MNLSLQQIIRGCQLAWLGSVLAFENRHLYKHSYVKTFGYLVGASIILYLVTSTILLIPLKILQLFLYLFSSDHNNHKFLENTNSWLINYVFNLPFLGLLFIRYIYPETLDSLFIESLRNVDFEHIKKHKEGDEDELRPPYAPALERYQYSSGSGYWKEMIQYLKRTGNQLKKVIALFLLSLLPFVGGFVYPIASAYALVNSLGKVPAIIVGILMYITPGTKSFAIIFLETLYSSRALMRELLEPYFGRIKFNDETKRKWFREREGILFGFSIVFYPLMRLPLLGMLFYGVAQAATALILGKRNTENE
ncbi:1693_t:CDS:2 [Diversispora eburnea]|uniref:1693_t:CDS:1 n=1 Tax=Diversispora eburnea TaxID=1213867 RepID=A0A9N8Z906_9GLOM|nr:1693_t:CDS:2 [Diversispora eburnea]